MMITRRLGISLLALLLCFGFSTALSATSILQVQDDISAENWRSDLQALANILEAVHPDLFYSMTHVEFESAISDLDSRIPQLTDNQIAAELMKLAALVGRRGRDGHTSLSPLQEALGFHLLPLRLYLFEDGLFVVDTTENFHHLIGAKVMQVGNKDTDELFQILEPYISRDNEWTIRSRIIVGYLFPELLHALGITENENSAEFEFQLPNGTHTNQVFSGLTAAEYVEAIPLVDLTGLPQQNSPLYLSNKFERFWLDHLESSSTLYIQYNGVQSTTQSGESIFSFSNRIADIVADEEIARVVVDVRHGQGGNNTTYGPLIDVLTSAEIDQCGKLFVIIGREVFSASVNFVTDLEQNLNATYIGEPTGGSPNQYGDARPFYLPNSNVEVGISTIYHEIGGPNDNRLAIDPDVSIFLSSQDFFANRDPVMDFIETVDPATLPCMQ